MQVILSWYKPHLIIVFDNQASYVIVLGSGLSNHTGK